MISSLIESLFGEGTATIIMILGGIILVAELLSKVSKSSKEDKETEYTLIDQWFNVLVERVYGNHAVNHIRRTNRQESFYAELMIAKDEAMLYVTIDELCSDHTIDGRPITPEVIYLWQEEIYRMMSIHHKGTMPEIFIENNQTKIVFAVPKELVDGDLLVDEIAMLRDFAKKHFEPRFGKQFSGGRNTSGEQGGSAANSNGFLSSEQLIELYGELGITPEATDSEVKKAYRTMAKRYHPDRYTIASEEEKQKVTARFRNITDAYELIKQLRNMK